MPEGYSACRSELVRDGGLTAYKYSAASTLPRAGAPPRQQNPSVQIRLHLQLDAEAFGDVLLDSPCQIQQLGAGGLSVVDQHQ